MITGAERPEPRRSLSGPCRTRRPRTRREPRRPVVDRAANGLCRRHGIARRPRFRHDELHAVGCSPSGPSPLEPPAAQVPSMQSNCLRGNAGFARQRSALDRPELSCVDDDADRAPGQAEAVRARDRDVQARAGGLHHGTPGSTRRSIPPQVMALFGLAFAVSAVDADGQFWTAFAVRMQQNGPVFAVPAAGRFDSRCPSNVHSGKTSASAANHQEPRPICCGSGSGYTQRKQRPP